MIAIAEDGRQVSIDRRGAKATLVGSEYLRPHPGGEFVRATFDVMIDDLTCCLRIDWLDDPTHLMFSQLRDGHMDGFRISTIPVRNRFKPFSPGGKPGRLRKNAG
jgi:hypothetical protein